MKKIFYLFCFLSLLSPAVQAQDVEGFFADIKARFSDPFKIGGGLNASANYYNTNNPVNRATPFNWRLNTNVNLNVVGIAIPINMAFSNGQAAYGYQLPSYSFVGFSPTYKWITLHFGSRSMEFSPYTLSGHQFEGYGVELKPGNFRFSAMYGKLRRARPEDLLARQSLDPVFERKGFGFKTGYDNGKDRLELILFSASDDPNSIPPLQLDSLLRPAENTVISLTGKKELGPKVFVEADYAYSAMTRNRMSPELQLGVKSFQRIGGLVSPKSSTGFHNALKTAVGYNADFGTVKFNFERIDPGYQTLGALFFNNDLENYTVSFSTALFNKKVNLNTNIGGQRNNLSGNESNTSGRFIGSLMATLQANDQLGFNVNYSNFSQTNRLRNLSDPLNPVDSLELALVNQSATISAVYTFPGENVQALTGMFAWQTANTIQNEIVQNDLTTSNYTGNISWLLQLKESEWSFTASLMANYAAITNFNTLSIAPVFSIAKPFLDGKMTTTTNFSISRIYTNKESGGTVYNWMGNVSYTLFEKHQIGLNMGFLKIDSPIPDAGFSEFRGAMNYGFSF